MKLSRSSFRFDDTTKNGLQTLAAINQCSQAEVVRVLVKTAVAENPILTLSKAGQTAIDLMQDAPRLAIDLMQEAPRLAIGQCNDDPDLQASLGHAITGEAEENTGQNAGQTAIDLIRNSPPPAIGQPRDEPYSPPYIIDKVEKNWFPRPQGGGSAEDGEQ